MRALLLLAPLLIITAGCERPAPTPVRPSPAAVTDGPVVPGHGQFSNAPEGDGTVFPSAFDTTEDVEDGRPVVAPPRLPTKLGALQGGVDDKLSESTGTTFQLTYYVISLRPKDDPNETKFYTCGGKFLTWASKPWRADAIMEGTARYRDMVTGESRTINIADGAGSCWLELDYSSRWGLGAWNNSTNTSFKLRPFRSIAIDRRELVMGAWYYVKELDGVQMPYPVSTMTHDGCVRAMDVGTAILGKHIDFFAGYYTAYEKLIQTPGTPMYHRYNVSIYSGRSKCKLHIDRGY